MKITDSPDAAVLDRLAELNCSILPESTISRLGKPYARRFFRLMAGTDAGRVFAAIEPGGEVVGGGVLVYDPDGLPRRLALQTPLAACLLVRPRLALALAREVLGGLLVRSAHEPSTEPEIIALFTDADRRSSGIGQRLMDAAENFLRTQNIAAYRVRTLDDPANRALSFYARIGMAPAGKIHNASGRYQLFRKTIE